MARYGILVLFALLLVACGAPVAPTLDSVPTQLVAEEAAYVTMTANAPTAVQKSADTRTSSPAETATPSPIPAPSFAPTLGSAPTDDQAPTTPAPSSTPLPEVETLTRNQDGMSMVYVPEGSFTMGSPAGEGGDDEVPLHKVTLDGFWIDRTEVTNAQYRIFVGATGHGEPTTCEWGDPTYGDETKANHPVVCVSWDDAKAYCEWAGARLPTEAEWEKAARGTDGWIYPWGINFDGSRANYCDTNCESSDKDTEADDGYAQTAPVGSYPTGVSPYGALDMAGNVWEWVSDWYHFYYYGKSPEYNPQGPSSGRYRVLRGGSWFGFSTNERTAFRAWFAPDKHDIAIGFRCVVSPTSP